MSSEIRRNFARRLKAALRDRQMTQRDLAEKLAAHESQVSRWCSGSAMPQTIEDLIRVAQVLRTSPAYLLFGVDVGGENWQAWLRLSQMDDESQRAVFHMIEALSSK